MKTSIRNIIKINLFKATFSSFFIACLGSISAFASGAIGDGNYSTTESGSGSGAGYYNCETTSDLRCPHWIKASIADFQTAWNNRVGSYTQSAYDICTNPNQNRDGFVVFTGKIQPGTTLRLHNILPYPYSNLGQSWKVVHRSSISAVYANGSETKRNFFNDTTFSGVTYFQLMSTLLLEAGIPEKEAAFFCDGMLEPDDPTSFDSMSTVRWGSTDAVSTGSSATLWGTNTMNDMPTYTVDPGTIYLSFSHSIRRTDSVSSSANAGYWVETNNSAVPGQYSRSNRGSVSLAAGVSFPNFAITGAKPVSIGAGESKDICQTLRYIPQISSNPSSEGYSQVCIKIKGNDLATFRTTSKVETVDAPIKSATANSGETKTLDNITTKDSSIELKFTHTLTRNPGNSSNVSEFKIKSSKNPTWTDAYTSSSGDVNSASITKSQTVTVNGLTPGETREVCQSVMIYPDKMKNGGNDPEVFVVATFSSVCAKIFREEDKIANFSATSSVKIGDYPEKTTPTGQTTVTDTRSTDTDITNVIFQHNITRTSVSGGANYGSNWNIGSASGFTTGASPVRTPTNLPVALNPGQTKVLSEIISYDKTVKNDVVTARSTSTATAVVTRNLISYSCPIDGSTVNQNSGTTKAQSSVRRVSGSSSRVETTIKSTATSYNSSNSRKVQLWAKPSDNIRFEHTLCFGAQAVRGGPERTTKPSTANTATISASATPSSSGNYLFGNSLSGSNNQAFNLPTGTLAADISTSILPATYATTGTPPANLKQNYFFTYNSPGRSTTAHSLARNSYRCDLTSGSSFNNDYDYQIRGKDGQPSCTGITTSDVGKTIRQQITWNKVDASVNSSSPHGFTTDQSNGNFTDAVEVKIPYNYTLKPIARTASGIAFADSSATISADIAVNARANTLVSSSAYATITKPSGYRIITFTLNSNVVMPTGNSPLVGADYVDGNWDKNMCAQYGLNTSNDINTGNNCQVVDQSNGLSEIFNKDANLAGNIDGENRIVDSYSKNVTIPDYPLGTKFCVAVGVFPADSHNTASLPTEAQNETAGLSTTGTTWNYSPINCYIIAKKPTVQFWGQSVYTTGGIKTGTSAKNIAGSPKIFGSWSEYDTIAKGTIATSGGKGFATGAAFGYIQGNGGTFMPSDSSPVPVTVTYTTAGTRNIPIPPGATNIIVHLWGAGGGGGSSDDDSSGSSAGGGGGGGGFIAHDFGLAGGGGTMVVTVGAAGAGGVSVNDSFNNGQNGGNTTVSFNGLTLTAGGGKGGNGAYAYACGFLWLNTCGVVHGDGGAGGSATGGNRENLPGTAGLKGGPGDGVLRANAAMRGAGGNSGGYGTIFTGGQGFKPDTGCYEADDGVGYQNFNAVGGGGGSGGCSIANPYRGGNGANGKIVVTYTPAPSTTDPGGLPASNDPCTYSSQTFNNASCNTKVIGQSEINNVSLQSTLEGLVSRYIDTSSSDSRPSPINLNGSHTCNLNPDGTYTASVPNPNYKCLSNGAKYIRVSGNANLNAATLPKGTATTSSTVVLDIIGELTIEGNVTYADVTYNSIAELPQLLIFAKKINIKNAVTQLDAWLIAGRNGNNITGKGLINTCSDVGDDPTANNFMDASGNVICYNKLKVNGPVFAEKLILNRAYGAGTGADVSIPAEIFNLRADTYMWAYAQAERYSQAVTTYSRELAPRY